MEKRKAFNMLLIVLVVGVLGVLALFVRPGSSADYVALLKTQGMTCSSCVGRIENFLKSQPGIESVKVDLEEGQVVFGYDSKVVKPEAVAEKVTALGYGSSVVQAISAEQYGKLEGKGSAGLTVGRAGCGCCNKSNEKPKQKEKEQNNEQ